MSPLITYDKDACQFKACNEAGETITVSHSIKYCVQALEHYHNAKVEEKELE